MNGAKRIGLALLLSALSAQAVDAQWNVARFDGARNRAYTAVGLDPALVTTLGYARLVTVAGHDVQLSADAGIAAAAMDVNDFRVRLGAQTSLVRWRSLHFTGSATFITRGTENTIYRGINLGSEFSGTAGVYRPKWFAAGELGFDKAIITHLTHTEWYRDNYYPDAKDGWYLDAGGTWHYGVAAGLAIGRTELTGRFGWRRSQDYNDLTPPLYGSLGIGVGF